MDGTVADGVDVDVEARGGGLQAGGDQFRALDRQLAVGAVRKGLVHGGVLRFQGAVVDDFQRGDVVHVAVVGGVVLLQILHSRLQHLRAFHHDAAADALLQVAPLLEFRHVLHAFGAQFAGGAAVHKAGDAQGAVHVEDLVVDPGDGLGIEPGQLAHDDLLRHGLDHVAGGLAALVPAEVGAAGQGIRGILGDVQHLKGLAVAPRLVDAVTDQQQGLVGTDGVQLFLPGAGLVKDPLGVAHAEIGLVVRVGRHILPDGGQDILLGHSGVHHQAGGEDGAHQGMAVGVDHAGDQHLAVQVHHLGAGLVGFDALVIAHVDDLVVLHRHGGDVGHLTVHGVHMTVFENSNHRQGSSSFVMDNLDAAVRGSQNTWPKASFT